MTPSPDSGWQKKQSKTYATPPEGAGDATLGDPATIDRTTPDSGLDRTKRSGSPLNDNDSVEAFKVPRDAAANAGEAIPVQPRQGSRPGPDVQAIPEEKGISVPLLPTVSLDEKIAWRAAPERKRLTIGKAVGNARLVRLPAYPKSDWIPVDAEAKVAKK